MAGGSEPVVDRGADPASFQRRFAFAFMPCDQEENSVPGFNRAFKRAIDRFPCAVEAMAVKVEDAIRLDLAAAQAPVPTAVQRRCPMRGHGPDQGRNRT